MKLGALHLDEAKEDDDHGSQDSHEEAVGDSPGGVFGMFGGL